MVSAVIEAMIEEMIEGVVVDMIAIVEMAVDMIAIVEEEVDMNHLVIVDMVVAEMIVAAMNVGMIAEVDTTEKGGRLNAMVMMPQGRDQSYNCKNVQPPSNLLPQLPVLPFLVEQNL